MTINTSQNLYLFVALCVSSSLQSSVVLLAAPTLKALDINPPWGASTTWNSAFMHMSSYSSVWRIRRNYDTHSKPQNIIVQWIFEQNCWKARLLKLSTNLRMNKPSRQPGSESPTGTKSESRLRHLVSKSCVTWHMTQPFPSNINFFFLTLTADGSYFICRLGTTCLLCRTVFSPTQAWAPRTLRSQCDLSALGAFGFFCSELL